MNKFCIILVLLTCQAIYPQNQSYYGLDFSYKYRKHQDRTSLRLTANNKLTIQNKLRLSSEISIDNPDEYGYILNVFSKKNSIRLIYYSKEDSASLQWVVNDKLELKEFKKHKSFFNRSNWFNVSFDLDLVKKRAILSINGEHSVQSSLGEMAVDQTEIIFGSFNEHNLLNNDISSFRLRNVKIFDEGSLKHYWKLDEAFGETAKDSKSYLDAKVINPNWMILNYFEFKNIARIGPFKGAEKEIIPAVVYNRKQNELIIVSNNFLFRFNLNNKKLQKEIYSSPLKQICYTAIYDDKKEKLFALYTGGGIVSNYISNEKKWVDVDSSIFKKGRYHGGNLFINPLNGDLCMIGGYGFYTVKNDLQKYNFEKKKWTKLKLKGDFLIPRAGALFGKINDSGDYYLFGGYGNESGKQIENYRGLNDIYVLSMKDTSIKKIAEVNNMTGTKLAYASLYYDSLKHQIVIMSWAQHKDIEKIYRVFNYSLKSKSLTVVSDSFKTHYIFNPPIFFDKTNNELVICSATLVGKDSIYVNIKSLNYPLLAKEKYNVLVKSNVPANFFSEHRTILFLVLVSLASFGLYFYKRNRRLKPVSLTQPVLGLIDRLHQQNCIYLFGDFRVFDKDSKDITKDFSPKIKQLFILLLMKSYNGTKHGITSQALTTYIWPDMSYDNAKNNRNVSINKLRSIVSGLDSIQINFSNNTWNLVVGDNVYCDYVFYHNVMNNGGDIITSGQKIRDILKCGELLQSESYEWFDGQKTQIIENSIKKMEKLVTSDKIDPETKIQIADSILLLDSVNEIGLNIKITSLIELGNHSLAKNTFDLFKKEYFRLYAEEYQKSFAKLLH